jgi:phosphatidylserine/phosphatidylglycerophosphate/cardiolipin synthase-like enzyme
MSNPSKNDGLPERGSIVEDFTVAKAFSDPKRVDALYQVFQKWDPEESVRIGANSIREVWLLSQGLTDRELESVFVCLLENDAAYEVAPGETYVDYTFEVDVGKARMVLKQQLIAANALDDVASEEEASSPSISPVATVPDPVDIADINTIAYTRGRVRRLLLNATSSVRVANPYFEADRTVLEDLAHLPGQGITTRILTRETDDPSKNLREALNNLYAEVGDDTAEFLEVRDLYEVDGESGHQDTATHAKLIIIDEESCYVGSANFTYHSLHRNFEFGLLLTGSPAKTITEVYDAVFEYADKVHLPLQ